MSLFLVCVGLALASFLFAIFCKDGDDAMVGALAGVVALILSFASYVGGY